MACVQYWDGYSGDRNRSRTSPRADDSGYVKSADITHFGWAVIGYAYNNNACVCRREGASLGCLSMLVVWLTLVSIDVAYEDGRAEKVWTILLH